MTDTGRVDKALDGRPNAAEVAGVPAGRSPTGLPQHAGPHPRRRSRRAGDDSIGDAGPIPPPMSSAWSVGTSPSVGHAKVAPHGANTPALQRVVRPGSGPAASPRPTPPTALLALVAGIGVMLALTGSVMIARGRR